MTPPLPGTIGILPSGALGVALFYHLTGSLSCLDGSVFFLERDGRPAGGAVRSRGASLRVADAAGVHSVAGVSVFPGGLKACGAAGRLPEVLLLCTNPDQLLPLLDPCVQVLERAHQEGDLREESIPLPALVLCANGIYFQRVRQVFIEKLEEATLLGRLPDLWPGLMPRIVGRLMRGVTIQTGVREGNGPDALYRPGPPGLTRLAGGEVALRRRVHEVLSRGGGMFELAEGSSPTRVEFDKGMVNLVANLLGQLVAIDSHGGFTPLSVGQVVERVGEAGVRELVGRVLEVGKGVRAYDVREDLERVTGATLENLRRHADHIPSSLQWLDLKLRRGEPVAGLAPTETWLLEPLLHYARSAGLAGAEEYLVGLRRELEAKLQQVARSRPPTPPPPRP